MGTDRQGGQQQVDELCVCSRGRWLVETFGSAHEFDLNNWLYLRRPGPGRRQFPHDAQAVLLTKVERWPVVGQEFIIWFDDPDQPERLVHWRVSSTVRRISRLEP
jgi:hypothetical protein